MGFEILVIIFSLGILETRCVGWNPQLPQSRGSMTSQRKCLQCRQGESVKGWGNVKKKWLIETYTLPETNVAPFFWMVGRLAPFWEGLFSGFRGYVSFREAPCIKSQVGVHVPQVGEGVNLIPAAMDFLPVNSNGNRKTHKLQVRLSRNCGFSMATITIIVNSHGNNCKNSTCQCTTTTTFTPSFKPNIDWTAHLV